MRWFRWMRSGKCTATFSLRWGFWSFCVNLINAWVKIEGGSAPPGSAAALGHPAEEEEGQTWLKSWRQLPMQSNFLKMCQENCLERWPKGSLRQASHETITPILLVNRSVRRKRLSVTTRQVWATRANWREPWQGGEQLRLLAKLKGRSLQAYMHATERFLIAANDVKKNTKISRKTSYKTWGEIFTFFFAGFDITPVISIYF